MIKDISQYPQATSPQTAAPVRKIDEEILTIVQNLKDTIDANSLDALSAYQIGSPYSIIVIKQDDGSFLELLNPLLVSMSGEQITQENTAYFPNMSAKVKRADNVSIMYEDMDMKEHNLKASGAFSVLLQRKIDYTYGATFLSKLDKAEKQLFENKLEFGVEAALVGACPTKYKRDYIAKLIDYLTILMLIVIGASFIVSDETPLFRYQIYIASSTVALNIFYFFYAQYESKKYGSCTNCQIGDILGTMGILLLRVVGVLVLSYFII